MSRGLDPNEGYIPSRVPREWYENALDLKARAELVEVQVRQVEHMSISGVQDKISLRLERGQLVPAQTGGEYILKPVPSATIPHFRDDVPANEHLTMQLAGQLFAIPVPANACVYLRDGELAYVVRRFDRRPDGEKVAQEDFCQLLGRTEDTHGRNYKYDATCEELARVLKRFCQAYPVEVEKLFHRVLFNYLFSNGDAHLKNFSLQQGEDGDYVLTPAYDLLCTSMHFPGESRTALELFDTLESAHVAANGFYGAADFLKLADVYGIKANRARRNLERFAARQAEVEALIAASFLSAAARADYLTRFRDRLKTMTDS